jgi:hypothetical protein
MDFIFRSEKKICTLGTRRTNNKKEEGTLATCRNINASPEFFGSQR